MRDRRRLITRIVPLPVKDWETEEKALTSAGLLRPAETPLAASFWKMPAPRAPAERAAAALRWARGKR